MRAPKPHPVADEEAVFELAARTFRVMSAPLRLRIIRHLCEGEKNVTELLELVQTTQPNMSQHLNTLYRAGLVARRREGVQIYYRVANEPVIALCRTLCAAIAAEAGLHHP
ncbi:ArsR/SmtB family transcription factor [Ramlibacter sp. MAHUQ-53]|uniref:ArsR/SmtB family transcription factor n=1 Tax=unclassified Ramlibacter TaxID=2617605 RepID=UPI0036421495